MKGLLLSCTIAFLSFGVVSATEDAYLPGQPVPFLQGYNAEYHDHFYTTNAQEMENAITLYKYNSEGDACRVFDFQAPGTVPLYHLLQPTVVDNFYTTDENERNSVQSSGYKYAGIAAYIYPSAVYGTVPFYRLYNPTVHDHYYTVNENGKKAAAQGGGYVDEGIAGYVFPV
ncbi:hypothetical protein EV421DRAFT_1910428 [Armillaria borealis]|uniref:DUF5648 domain-containing protein n=1 Tax=Armillaria borealis TaxID=47425 RepID=A0AA39IYT2_9AGAR|nr:hypothetical protein EV421DRAFT_1910428 [Armillaria borealis]